MVKKYKTIVSIETSCDETSLALVRASGTVTKPTFTIIKHIISSQIEIHRPFGGVVPNLAKREHIQNLPILFEQLIGTGKTAEKIKKEIDFIAVTVGPGLEPALWTGINFAQKIGEELHIPVYGVSHMEGHLYSFLLPSSSTKRSTFYALGSKTIFPMITLLVSGGHTLLVLLKNMKDKTILGQTRDDAVGEAYDKVARLLDLPYPGGPEIEKLARVGKKDVFAFPRPMMKTNDYDFSFSGLKTSVLYTVRDIKEATKKPLDEHTIQNLSASFQEAAVETLVTKTKKAVLQYKAKSVSVCGGVAANSYLREKLSDMAKTQKIKMLVPEKELNTDNAAMIAAAGYINFLQKKSHPLSADGNLLF